MSSARARFCCAANGVMVETVQFLTHVMSEGTRLKNLPELLAASGESRAMKVDREDDKDMHQICDAVVETKKRVFTLPVIVRYYSLSLVQAALSAPQVWASFAPQQDLYSAS